MYDYAGYMLPMQPAIAGHSLPRAAKKGYVSDGLETEPTSVGGLASSFRLHRSEVPPHQ